LTNLPFPLELNQWVQYQTFLATTWCKNKYNPPAPGSTNNPKGGGRGRGKDDDEEDDDDSEEER
jgi:hypothetical protein